MNWLLVQTNASFICCAKCLYGKFMPAMYWQISVRSFLIALKQPKHQDSVHDHELLGSGRVLNEGITRFEQNPEE